LSARTAAIVVAACVAITGAYELLIAIFPTHRRLTLPAYWYWGGPRRLPRLLNGVLGSVLFVFGLAVAIAVAAQ
jgi:hypothetical protein